MQKNLKTLYFSPTKSTSKIVRAVAEGFEAKALCEEQSITFPEAMGL